ncbi:DNA polymerase IV [Candidatus Spongiihabitans sp.]|uniref:DNA polymerase IV n=1 Tax=Candidatus Spongiihabitans sp. TaxID=3101308 RepID=UPI003C7B6ADA
MILHIDMDAFYASVEERENPELKGKPLIVGGQASTRGVVAAANYAARKYGIHSAMPTASAVKKCPDLLIVKPRGELYSRISKQIRAIFYRYTPIIEPLSLDEAFLDPHGSERLHGDAEAIGRKIKTDLKSELDLVASVGVAPNKFVAKLASDFDKPDGFVIVMLDEVQAFLDPLPVNKIWGVGKAANVKLSRHNIRTVCDLKTKSPQFLDQLFGQYGEQLWRLAHGIDERKVTPDREVKSVSQETTFAQDLTYYPSIESTALYLTEGVGYRLRESELKGKTVTIKIRYDDFKTITRSRSLDCQTSQTNELWKVVKTLFQETLGNKSFAIRLIGVGISNFSEANFGEDEELATQTDLFSTPPKTPKPEAKGQLLDQLSDEIKHKFGKQSIKRGKSVC